jgi:uncharacterized membrane protein YoaK (UPF0700 family)
VIELDKVLAADEKLLWQGRPDTGVFITGSQVGRTIRVFIALILLGYILARLGYGLPPMTDIRVIVILIIFQAVPLEIVKSAYLRRRTVYALTSSRAIISVQLPVFGQVIRSVPLTAMTQTLYRAGRVLSSLYFGVEKRKLWDLRGYAAADGFERIKDGQAVFALVGQVQQGKI